MVSSLRQHLFRHLGAISMLAATGAVAPAVALADIPDDVLSDATADGLDEIDCTDDDRLALLRLLASDARPQIRAGAADGMTRLGKVDPAQVEALLLQLARDDWSEVRLASALALASHLSAVSPLAQLEVVAGWATDDHPGPREALAHALSSSRPVFLADMALEVLAADRQPEVRRAAVQAIRNRVAEAPASYRRILEARAHDADRRVRHAARRGLVEFRAQA